MESYFLSHGLAQDLNGVVNIIFDSFDEQPVAVGVVDVHEISGFFKINAAALIAVDHDD